VTPAAPRPADAPPTTPAPMAPTLPAGAGRVRLTDAQREALAPLLARLMAAAWRRRHPQGAAQTAEGRTPHPLDARPSRSKKEKLGGPNTGCPTESVPRRA
jgi:hypothetical protein